MRGRALLTERVAEAAAAVARIPETLDRLPQAPNGLPRMLVTSGIGTSEGHARHLAEACVRWLGWPARFVDSGALAAGAPPGSSADWLVVFSQGLSANARFALADAGAWGGVILVTGLGEQEADGDAIASEKRAWLAHLEALGVVRVDMGCGTEYGALLRVVGARVGYAVAWSLLRALAERILVSPAALQADAADLRSAQLEAPLEVARAFPVEDPIAPFFAGDRPLLIVAEGGVLELAEQLSLKLSEGMLRPQPRCVDVLRFAHGPLQSLATREASILYLAAREPTPDATAWQRRLEATLDPARHDLRMLRARLPWPFAMLEYEAMGDEVVLRSLAETGVDLVDWPGAEREHALYDAGPRLPPEAASRRIASAIGSGPRLEQAVWPEIEARVTAGQRTALIALGSVEQHGPHLPLGTDHWIAEALACGLAARLDDAIALPPVAFGCASEHLDFAGTLHVAPATLEAILRDLIASLTRHGFERAFLFTAHGGNLDALESMRERLVRQVAPLALRIETDLRVGAMQSAAVEAEAIAGTSAGPHAGEYETSVVAWLRPGSVRRTELVPGRVVARGEGQGLFYPSLRPNAERGVLGDPSAASADRGERYLEAWLDLLEAAYRRAF